MLILIDRQISENLDELITDPEFVESIDNLAIGHRKGNHIVGGIGASLRRLSDAFASNAQISGTLRSIAAKSHEQAALVSKLSDYIIVEARRNTEVIRELTCDGTIYRVSYRYFSRFESIVCGRIVGEDATDVAIYLKVLEAYLHFKGSELRPLCAKHQGIAGGGSSTEDQFSTLAIDGPTLAIVDSDQRYPGAPLGATAAALQRAAATLADSTVSGIEVLQCHELENALPSKLVLACLTVHDSRHFVQSVESLCERVLGGSFDPRYFDLKTGVMGWDILKSATPAAREYHGQWGALITSGVTCEVPNCEARSSCRCVHVPGFGAGFLVRVAEHLKELTRQKVSEYFFATGAGTRELWLAIGRRLLSWTCAARPLRV